MAKTGKMQTYHDNINALLKRSVILPPELLAQVENFIKKIKQLSYTIKEQFIRDAIRFKLTILSEEHEYIEIPKTVIQSVERGSKRNEHTILHCGRLHKHHACYFPLS